MDSWPNQEALNKALNIYRVSMRSFIIFHLKKIPGMNVEDVVINSVGDWRADEIDRILSESDRDIEFVIDINDFPHLVNKNWGDAFERTLNDDKTFRNQLWLIVECRNADWAHPPEGDAEFESTQAHLFLIADILGKINKSDAKDRVKIIRDGLDDTAERLVEAEERLAGAEAKKNDYKERLETTSKELKKIKAELKTSEKRLTTAKTEKNDYKERLAITSKELEEAKKEWKTCEDDLKSTSDRLEEAVGEWVTSVECLVATRKLFTAATIGSQAIQKICPSFETDSAVRILDRRGTDKRNYLSRLLDQKQPTLIYVQSEDKIHQLLDLVGPEKAAVIGTHSQQTSETEETEILKKLENKELIAAVSNATFSELQMSDCVEHFVFCHLASNSDAFFDRCQPAFTSKKGTYLHLIYESKQKIKELAEKYPKDELLRKLYQKIRNLTPIGKSINFEELHSALCKDNELDIAKLGFETGLVIFEELGLIKQNGETIKRLGDVRTELNKSKTYCVGAGLKKEIENSPSFQYEHSIEQIWEKMLEALNVDSNQMLHESSIHKMPLRVSETEGDYLKDAQTQPEQSTEVVEKDSAVSQATKGKAQKKKPSIAERYTSETTEADRDAVAVKVVEMRINAAGSKGMSWRRIREKLGLRNDEFHKVLRPSKGYRKAVIDRIKQLKSRPEGWEYSGKLEVLTGIQISEPELE